MLRLFVGLTFAADYRRRLLPFMTGVLGVHWQPEENLHMTLRFLGDVSMNDAEDLDAELARINVPAFDLTLQGAGWFGVGDRVQNLHLKARPDPMIDGLKAQVDRACHRAGFRPESRKFAPHVTLARLRQVRLETVQPWIEEHAAVTLRMGDVEAFHLISSHPNGPGRAYRIEASYPLHQMWA